MISDPHPPARPLPEARPIHSTMRYPTLLAATLFTLAATAQTEVRQSTYIFSDGAHPTFVVTFGQADASQMESWYKGQLKDYSEDVTSKKETRAAGARVAEVSPDTILVLCKAEKAKSSGVVSLHLAFRVNGTYVSASSDKLMIEGAKSFSYTKAVAYKKQVLQHALDDAEKELALRQGELATLVKDKGRADEGIKKNQEKGVEAAQDKVQAEADLRTNELSVQGKQAEIAASPSEANTDALNSLMKDQAKLKDKIERLGKQSVDADKKVKDLEETIKKNLAAQEAKGKVIAEATKKVDELRAAVANVN